MFEAATYFAFFLYHKSATTCQIDSNKVPNSKLKPDLCNCVKTEIIESTAPPQWPHLLGTIILGHLVFILSELLEITVAIYL